MLASIILGGGAMNDDARQPKRLQYLRKFIRRNFVSSDCFMRWQTAKFDCTLDNFFSPVSLPSLAIAGGILFLVASLGFSVQRH